MKHTLAAILLIFGCLRVEITFANIVITGSTDTQFTMIQGNSTDQHDDWGGQDFANNINSVGSTGANMLIRFELPSLNINNSSEIPKATKVSR